MAASGRLRRIARIKGRCQNFLHRLLKSIEIRPELIEQPHETAVVPQGMQVPEGSLVAGVPAATRKTLSLERRQGLRKWAEKYIEVAKAHQARAHA